MFSIVVAVLFAIRSYSLVLTHWNTKLQERVCWFYMYLMCFLWLNKFLFMHSITLKHNFIKIVKKCPYFPAHIYWDFVQIFGKSKLLGVRFHPKLLHHFGSVFVVLTAAYHTVCMVSRPHLQVTAIAAWQAHGPQDHAAGWQSHLHFNHR